MLIAGMTPESAFAAFVRKPGGEGLPAAVEVTAGQRHGSTQVEPALDGIAILQPVGRPRRPKRLAGDKGYSYCHSC
ncbi:MAG: hypothetical protein ACYS74_06585 [Planctomycetota bacterium]|jgi:hypothetical protein